MKRRKHLCLPAAFSRRAGRKSLRKAGRVESTRLRLVRVERLEDRTLLHGGTIGANVIETIDGDIREPFASNEIIFNSAESASSLLYGFRVRADQGGTLDPAPVEIRDSNGVQLASVFAAANSNGATDSLVLASIPPGEFKVMVSGENGTTGALHLDLLIPGDLNGDGVIGQDELLMATAAVVQQQGNGNHLTQQFYLSHGINLAKDLYQVELDVNLDGKVDSMDLKHATANRNRSVGPVELFADNSAPTVAVGLRSDTGRSNSDGVTTDATIVGSLIDSASGRFKLFGGFNGASSARSFDLSDTVASDGTFTLTLDRLEQVAGGPLANSGRQTLFLIAEDAFGNATPPLPAVSFELDTIAPAAPSALDLVATSDTGESNSDNVTNDSTPTFSVSGDPTDLVMLFSSLRVDSIGQVELGGTSQITSVALADGTHSITATATDIAGNVSGSSSPLLVVIDTVAPLEPVFELDPAAPRMTGDGFPMTAATAVALEGTTDPNTRVELRSGTSAVLDTQTSDAAGAFRFEGVSLDDFGENIRRTAAIDVAGNQSLFTQFIVRNAAPVLADPLDDVNVDEDPGQATNLSLSGLFTDPDLNGTAGDTLTLSIIDNTVSAFATATLTDDSATANILDDQLSLDFLPNANGSGQITLRGTDSFGLTADFTLSVVVNPVNDVPVVEGTLLEPVEDTTAELDLRILVEDLETPDDELVFQVGGATNGTVELLEDGHTVRFTPAANYNGSAEFTYGVTDTGEGDSPPQSVLDVTIDVIVGPQNDAPEADGAMLTTDEDQTVDVDLRTLVSDVETPADGLIFAVSGGVGGTPELLGDGHTARFHPDANFNDNRGPSSFDYSVTDTGDDTSPAITISDVTIDVMVQPVNDDPTAVDDARSISNDQVTESIAVLANDDDPDQVEGDTLTIIEINGQPIVTGGSLELDSGAFLTLNADGTLQYDPDGEFDDLQPGETVLETFTYTIVDAAANVPSTATVELTLASNVAPIPVDDAASTDEETALDIDVLADNGLGADTDPDGDDGLLSVSQFDATSALGATITLNPNGTLNYDPSDSSRLDEVAQDGSEVDTFTYTIVDGEGIESAIRATVSVTVFGLNDSPVAVDDSVNTDEDTSIAIDVLADNGAGADTDPDSGDTLQVDSFEPTSAQGASVSLGPGGSLVYDPADSAGLNSLAAGDSVNDTFGYVVTDGLGGFSGATVTIRVDGRNDDPVAAPDRVSTDEDTAIDIAVLADNGSGPDSDPDTGDVLEIFSFNATSELGATVSLGANATLRYNPTTIPDINAWSLGEVREDSFDYEITDNQGGLAGATITIDISGLNDSPTANNDSLTINAGTPTDIDVLAGVGSAPDSDPDSADTLVVGSVDAQSTLGATLSINANGTLRYDPRTSNPLRSLTAGNTATDTFQYTASDGNGGQSQATVSVEAVGTRVRIELVTTDLDGNLVTSVTAGDDFQLRGLVEDVAIPADGVFAAFVDIRVDDASLVSIVFGETQTLTLSENTIGGSFTLGFGSTTSDPIAYDVKINKLNSNIQSALDSLLGPLNYELTHTPQLDSEGQLVNSNIFAVRFIGDLAGTDVANMVANGSNLTTNDGNSATATVEQSSPADISDPVTYQSSFSAGQCDPEFGDFSPCYGNGRSAVDEPAGPGAPATQSVFGEVGGFDGQTPLGGGQFLLFTVTLTANGPGQVEFAGDPADVTGKEDVLVFRANDPVPPLQVAYGLTTIEILPSPTAGGGGSSQASIDEQVAGFAALAAPAQSHESSPGTQSEPQTSFVGADGADLATGNFASDSGHASSEHVHTSAELAGADHTPNDASWDGVLDDIAEDIAGEWLGK